MELSLVLECLYTSMCLAVALNCSIKSEVVSTSRILVVGAPQLHKRTLAM